MSVPENPQIDFDELLKDMDDSAELFDMADVTKNLDFTNDQIRFINTIIVSAIRRYHESLFPKT